MTERQKVLAFMATRLYPHTAAQGSRAIQSVNLALDILAEVMRVNPNYNHLTNPD